MCSLPLAQCEGLARRGVSLDSLLLVGRGYAWDEFYPVSPLTVHPLGLGSRDFVVGLAEGDEGV